MNFYRKQQKPQQQNRVLRKIRLKTSIAGNAEPRYGLAPFAFAPGQEVELDERLAAHWIASGVAEAIAVSMSAATAGILPD